MKKENLKENFEINLTKDLYLQVSTDKAAKITELKDEKDAVTRQISRYTQKLDNLYTLLKTTKGEVRLARAALKKNKNTKWALKRELILQNKFAKRINKACINGDESIDVRKFYTSKELEESMEYDFPLDKNLYLKISIDKATKISELKEARDNIIVEIGRNIEKIENLNAEVRALNEKISLTQTALSESKNKKWSLTRELSLQNKFAKRINKAYSRGDEIVDITKFYTAEEQKTR